MKFKIFSLIIHFIILYLCLALYINNNFPKIPPSIQISNTILMPIEKIEAEIAYIQAEENKELAKTQQLILQAETKLTDLQEKYNSLTEEQTRLETLKNSLKQEVLNQQSTIDNNSNKIKKLEEETNELTKNKTKKTNELANITKQLKTQEQAKIKQQKDTILKNKNIAEQQKKYMKVLQQYVSSNWYNPSLAEINNLTCDFLLKIAEDGSIIKINLIRSSGNNSFDKSALAAILKSSPLPIMHEVAILDRPDNIVFTFNPN